MQSLKQMNTQKHESRIDKRTNETVKRTNQNKKFWRHLLKIRRKKPKY